MSFPIRYILHTMSTLTDKNGYRYHIGTITNTKTRKSVKIQDLGGDSNLSYSMSGLGLRDVCETFSSTIGKREYPALAKGGIYERDLLPHLLHVLTHDDRVTAIRHRMELHIKSVVHAVEVENDSRYIGQARDIAEHNGDIARSEIQGFASMLGLGIQWPGIYPCFMVAGGGCLYASDDCSEVAAGMVANWEAGQAENGCA